MRLKIFEYELTGYGWKKEGCDGDTDFRSKNNVENDINDFCKDHDVLEIKVNTYTAHRHNNAGVDLVKILFTVIYMEK